MKISAGIVAGDKVKGIEALWLWSEEGKAVVCRHRSGSSGDLVAYSGHIIRFGARNNPKVSVSKDKWTCRAINRRLLLRRLLVIEKW